MTDKDDFTIWVMNTGGAIAHDTVAWSAWQAALKLERSKAHGEPEGFDAWQQNPYTVALYKSIAEDYHPAHTEAPAWHDAPNAPGLWVVGSRCLQINELDLPIYERSNCRWYGPIPDDGGKP